VALPNSAEFFECLLAVMQAGWQLVPLNIHLTASEMAYILRDSAAKVFVANERIADPARAAAGLADIADIAKSACLSVGTIEGFRPLADATAGVSAETPTLRRAGQLMQYTSGTTGRPKGVRRAPLPLDPDSAALAYAQHLLRFDVEPGGMGVHLCGSPLYHLAALAFSWFSLHLDHTVVLLDGWSPEEALRRIERHRVTTTHMVPTQFHRLLQLPESVRSSYDTRSLRNVMHAAAPCPVEVKRRMLEWWGPVIYEYYGATEGGGTLAKPDEWLRKPGTVGKAWAGADVRVYDDAGALCPPRQPGTVYMKVLQEFEYHGDAEKTRASRRDGYFTVGDIGYLDEDGYLFLCDRKIDMIISGGVNIYPAEVEAALLAHPAVGDAAVFGIPDDDWGERVHAVVEPAAGRRPGAALAEELLEHCRRSLARFKCPRAIEFTDELPRDPSGKLYKRRLRDPYWKGRERSI
jgi:long-chain acyl-CoA synthetase